MIKQTQAVRLINKGQFYIHSTAGMFADIKGVIRNHKSMKDRKYNGQKKKDKWTNNDIQNTT